MKRHRENLDNPNSTLIELPRNNSFREKEGSLVLLFSPYPHVFPKFLAAMAMSTMFIMSSRFKSQFIS